MTRKALILVDHLGGGGTLPFVTRYARYLKNNGFECFLNGADFEDAASGRARMPVELTNFRGYVSSLCFLFSRPRDFSVISAHSPKSLLLAKFIKLINSPGAIVIFTLHWPVDSSEIAIIIKRRLYRSADKIHAISTSTRDILLQRYRVRIGKIVTFHIDVDASRFRPPDQEARHRFFSRLNMDTRHPVLGYVGRLDREKNVDFLIRFANDYGNNVRPINVLIYGDGPLREQILSSIRISSGPSDIHYMGFTHLPEIAFGMMDLNILPSSFEGFPLTVAEAGLCETPTVRSSVEGSYDQIEDGRTGFLFDLDGGYDAFYARLAGVLNTIGHDAADFRPALREIGKQSRLHFRKICGHEQFEKNCKTLFFGNALTDYFQYDRLGGQNGEI